MKVIFVLITALFLTGCSMVTTGKDGVPKANSVDVDPGKISALSEILRSWVNEKK